MYLLRLFPGMSVLFPGMSVLFPGMNDLFPGMNDAFPGILNGEKTNSLSIRRGYAKKNSGKASYTLPE
jgi:hypothetical protein